MTGHLGEGDLARMARGGMAALTAAEGLALLDAAIGRDEALLVPARLDVAGLRAAGRARARRCPALWRGLAGRPAPAGRAAAGGRPRKRPGGVRCGSGWRGCPRPERDRVLLDLVRAHAAAVLGHASAGGGGGRPGVH